MGDTRPSPTTEFNGALSQKQISRRISTLLHGVSLRPICKSEISASPTSMRRMKRRSPPFLARGYHLLAEVQNQFSTDSELFTSMGTALLLAKQTTEAELAFERALQLTPESVAAERNVASAYLQAGDLDRAVSHLERALRIDPLQSARR